MHGSDHIRIDILNLDLIVNRSGDGVPVRISLRRVEVMPRVYLIFRNLKDKQGLDLRFLPKLPGLANGSFYLPRRNSGCSRS